VIKVKIAVVSDENKGLNSPVATRFARARYIVIVDVDEEWSIKEVKVKDNTAVASGSGAGVKIVQTLNELGADVAVGPSFGPNATVALNEVGIKAIAAPPGTPVKDVIKIVKDQLTV